MTLTRVIASAAMLLMATFVIVPTVSAQERGTRDFLNQLAAATEAEMRAVDMVKERGNSQPIKQLADKLNSYHREMRADLRDLANDAGVRNFEPNLQDRHREILDDLRNRRSNDLDAQYVRAQASLYQEQIKLLDEYARNGEDRRLRDFAHRQADAVRNQIKMLGGYEGFTVPAN